MFCNFYDLSFNSPVILKFLSQTKYFTCQYAVIYWNEVEAQLNCHSPDTKLAKYNAPIKYKERLKLNGTNALMHLEIMTILSSCGLC